MLNRWRAAAAGGFAAAVLVAGASAGTQRAQTGEREDYERVPMPPGIQVIASELEGPVFADAGGKTLYRWPLRDLRNGDAGEQRGKPSCDDRVYTVNSGLMSPYPPGLELPDVATRPSCVQMWPPLLAADDAKPVGRWTIVKRPNGAKQWAYDGYALYTSTFDRQPGDVLGGTNRRAKTDWPAVREPVGPPPAVPAEFNVTEVATGRLLVNHEGYSVYFSDKDPPGKSACDAACLKEWTPVLAPEFVEARGEWTVIDRSPGIRQWAFRKKPLYIHIADRKLRSYEGADVSGWHNAYTQHAPAPPKEFTVQDTRSGEVLADARGHTIYVYRCNDDAVDQLECDKPETTQAYRLTVCGGGDAGRCLATFPYVIAAKDAKSDNRTWTTMDIDSMTGRRAQPGDPKALHVWAYRDRPVYTFIRDQKPGDIWADAWGEFHGKRNGFKAFWLRDDFRDNDA